jgi:hypothetical protein
LNKFVSCVHEAAPQISPIAETWPDEKDVDDEKEHEPNHHDKAAFGGIET